MPAPNFQELPVACQMNGISRETLEAYMAEGDGPHIFAVAGRVVVHADEFRQWATRVHIEHREVCEQCND